MPKLIYGVWDGIVYDNRGVDVPVSPEGWDLSLFDHFDEGNPARIFLSERGFLVFSADAPLLWALWKHFDKGCLGILAASVRPVGQARLCCATALAHACGDGNVDWAQCPRYC